MYHFANFGASNRFLVFTMVKSMELLLQSWLFLLNFLGVVCPSFVGRYFVIKSGRIELFWLKIRRDNTIIIIWKNRFLDGGNGLRTRGRVLRDRKLGPCTKTWGIWINLPSTQWAQRLLHIDGGVDVRTGKRVISSVWFSYHRDGYSISRNQSRIRTESNLQ